MSNSLPLVSVIVPIYNSADYVGLCLQSINDQTYGNIELVVVDSERSTDDAKKVAEKYKATYFKYGAERSIQRNYGVKKAKGEYVAIIDSDMKLDKKVIADCVEVAMKSNSGAVIIPEKSYGEGFWAECKALERNCYIGDETIEAARFFLKSVYTKLGGFNERMISGEDWDLTVRVRKEGLQVGRVKSLILHNEGKINLYKDLKKKLYYAKNADAYLSANAPGLLQTLLFIFRPAYFRNWKMLLSDPIHFVGFVIMKFLEIFVGGMAIITKKTFWTNLVNIGKV